MPGETCFGQLAMSRPSASTLEKPKITLAGDLMIRTLASWQAEPKTLTIIDRAFVGRDDMPSPAEFKEGSAPEGGG
jgi:hypothetical protein